jgi:hypothetical protein
MTLMPMQTQTLLQTQPLTLPQTQPLLPIQIQKMELQRRIHRHLTLIMWIQRRILQLLMLLLLLLRLHNHLRQFALLGCKEVLENRKNIQMHGNIRYGLFTCRRTSHFFGGV